MAEAVTVPRKRGMWQRMLEFDSRHPLLWNLFPIFLFSLPAALAVVLAAVGEIDPVDPLLQVLLVAMFLVPTIWRRRYPFAVLLSQCVPLAITIPMGYTSEESAGFVNSAAAVAFTFVLYNLVVRRPLKLLWWAGMVSLVPSLIDWLVNQNLSVGSFLAFFAPTVIYFGFIVAIGMLMRTRREFQHSERDQAAQQAVTEERNRIAREMHDIIGHNLAVINALADGGAYAATAAPEKAKEALEAIGRTSREALSELRRVLSVLKAEEGEDLELAPQPGLAELDALIERVREAGLPVTVSVAGDPWALSENQQLAVYRTVQESLTNVFKHARGVRRAEVSMEYRDAGLSVTVRNTGNRVDEAGTARGLAGLSERAAAFGGTMVAGPEALGGWRVALWLPEDGEERR
ncbi:sensor histidine kinase [Glycomyces algeriensis]|uniref:histidine kinase n=1 Tax=Glycomyces algeriensis TaxID=256037 RepID=A0A9W6GBC3_9ACTN|nr:sensor histidine kinase [Glycomyces algeriensis]MDA1368870.1 sensor histidine kinase [Glycomyces algeriensis]MDR7350886.1 signal transduction histidine kinase [Glycomyces algeriensis]GLI43598.1 two-component sensor histidine kinase [Glycomyces algeriensis]